MDNGFRFSSGLFSSTFTSLGASRSQLRELRNDVRSIFELNNSEMKKLKKLNHVLGEGCEIKIIARQEGLGVQKNI